MREYSMSGFGWASSFGEVVDPGEHEDDDHAEGDADVEGVVDDGGHGGDSRHCDEICSDLAGFCPVLVTSALVTEAEIAKLCCNADNNPKILIAEMKGRLEGG